MSVVLDSGGVSALASEREQALQALRYSAAAPMVPAAVLTEVLTGDHRRDHTVNRYLRLCVVRDIDEPLAREAARLRTATGRAGSISAVDAIVAAVAAEEAGSVVLTSDPDDLRALSAHASTPFAVGAV